MRTDRELLDLSAKAAGIKIDLVYTDQHPPTSLPDGYLVIINGSGGHSFWSPLADDGDALRLVVKLGLAVEVDLCDDTTRVCETECELLAKHMHFDGDPEAATRRAIVRAAAHIGATKEA
jgi:hypothetical protein